MQSIQDFIANSEQFIVPYASSLVAGVCVASFGGLLVAGLPASPAIVAAVLVTTVALSIISRYLIQKTANDAEKRTIIKGFSMIAIEPLLIKFIISNVFPGVVLGYLGLFAFQALTVIGSQIMLAGLSKVTGRPYPHSLNV